MVPVWPCLDPVKEESGGLNRWIDVCCTNNFNVDIEEESDVLRCAAMCCSVCDKVTFQASSRKNLSSVYRISSGGHLCLTSLKEDNRVGSMVHDTSTDWQPSPSI